MLRRRNGNLHRLLHRNGYRLRYSHRPKNVNRHCSHRSKNVNFRHMSLTMSATDCCTNLTNADCCTNLTNANCCYTSWKDAVLNYCSQAAML